MDSQMNFADKQIDALEETLRTLLRQHFCPALYRGWCLNKNERQRILILKAWKIRYKVSYAYILQLLVPIYRTLFKTYSPDRLGVRWSTLTSPRSRQILEDTLIRDFPNGENVNAWRLMQRRKISGTANFTEQDMRSHPMLFPGAYRERVEDYRGQMHEALEKPQRPYRDNPFL